MRYAITRQFSQSNEVLQHHVANVAPRDGMRGQGHVPCTFASNGGLMTRIEEYANFVPDHAAGTG